MEPNPNEFSLNAAISKWQQNLQNGALTTDDIAELTQHLNDELAVLQSIGLNDEEAWLIARRRMGQPQVIEAEFSKVNPDFVASRNWLMLFWGATLFMVMQTLFLIVPGIFKYILVGHNSPNFKNTILSEVEVRNMLYVFSVIMLIWLAFSLTKANNLSSWFNGILVRYSALMSALLIVIGSFAATLNYNTISNTMFRHSQNEWIFNQAKDLFGVIFYGSLLFCTAWFTMRYRKQEFRNIKLFSRDINWLMALTFGIMIQLMVSFSNIFQFKPLSLALNAALFSLAGWMAGQSKKFILNMAMIQVCALYVYWFVGYYSAHHTLLSTIIDYGIVVIALLTGCILSRKNNYQLQIS